MPPSVSLPRKNLGVNEMRPRPLWASRGMRSDEAISREGRPIVEMEPVVAAERMLRLQWRITWAEASSAPHFNIIQCR